MAKRDPKPPRSTRTFDAGPTQPVAKPKGYQSTATTTPNSKPGVQTVDGHIITRGRDGTITVEGPVADQARIPVTGEFDENLATGMNISERKGIALRLIEFADVDVTSRKDWEDREKRAREMLGIKDIPKEQEQQDGHDTTHPMLMEASVRFQANAITELFPPGGPAETKVLGKSTPEKMARAHRLRTFTNHYLTDTDQGYFNDTDKMLMYLPMGGSVFRRAAQDYTTGLPILRHVKATNFIAPYAGTDLPSMPRYAWKFTMTGEDIDRAMQIGMFADIHLPKPAMGQAKHAPSADASDLREPLTHERDRIYSMLEYHIDLELDFDPLGAGKARLKKRDTGLRPYIVVVDEESAEVLMVRRNWREKDKKNHKKRIWFAHHQFLPGLGFYGWGYPHVIGSLGLAASGAVNALLDSAVAANFQGGFVDKQSKIAGEFRLEHGVWKQVDSSGEDLAKSFYTPPFKEPSPALFQLLGILVDSGQRFTGTTDAAVGDGNNTGPVGTTVALIDQAQKPMSAIHKRLHVSMSQELQMLCDLIEDFMPDRYDYTIGDEQQFLLKKDFAPGVDIVCVTDPGVSSDTQRIMRGQAVLDLQEKAPHLYPPTKQAEAHRRFLVALKVPNIDQIGPEVATPKYLDAVSENALMFAGKPVRVFPTQDDRAHIAIHQDANARAQSLFPPDVYDKVIQPALMAHIRDHMASSYYKQIMVASGLTPNFDVDGQPQGLSPQVEAKISAKVAGTIAKLPHPKPKPGTPSAEQQQAQQKVAEMQQLAAQTLDHKEQAFQADERRKQQAWEAEEIRKDKALNYQEARTDSAMAGDLVRTAVSTELDRRAAAGKHAQDLQQGQETHDAGLEQGQEQHDQQVQQGAEKHGEELEQGAEVAGAKIKQGTEAHKQGLKQDQEVHDQGLEQGDATHEQQIDQGAQTHEQKIAQAGEAGAAKLKQAGAAHSQKIKQGAESHEQGLQQGEESHKQSLEQVEKEDTLAAAQEGHADSHGGDGK